MKTIKTTITMLALISGLALLAGCGSDDGPVAPAPDPVPMADVTWRAERLNVIEDCDDSGGAGDFYISFTLSDYTSGEEVVLAERRRVLVQVHRDNVVWHDDINIELTSEVPLKDGTRLLLSMSLYENDPDGPQVSSGNGWYYTYDAASESWVSEDDGDKTMKVGRFVQETLQLEDYQGDDCNAFLRGRFSMEPVEE